MSDSPIHELAVALSAHTEELCQRFLSNGKRVGNNWICGGIRNPPDPDGDSCSVVLEGPKAGLWCDFGDCPEEESKGDAFDIARFGAQCPDNIKTADWAREFLRLPAWQSNGHHAPKVFDPLTQDWKSGRDSKITLRGDTAYTYHHPEGEIIGYTVRFDGKKAGEKKQLRPLTFQNGRWIWKAWPDKFHPIYNAHLIVSRPNDPILILEGEKSADAAAKLFRSHVCISWYRGSGAVREPDWSPLVGRDVTLWPDADKPGREAMNYLKSLHPHCKVVDVSGLPEGWDLADKVPDGVSIKGLMDGAAVKSAPVAASEEDAESFLSVTAWIRGVILESMVNTKSPAASRNSAVAENVVSALAKFGRFYFHSDLRDFDSAMFFDSNRKRLERVRSDSFSAWLSEWLVLNRASQLFKFVLSSIETASLSGKHTQGIVPESYWASRKGSIYLSNGDGAAVKITAEGMQPVDNGTDGVLFSVGLTLDEWKLTAPRDPFETCELFRGVHCGSSHGKDLLRLWMYSFPTAPRSKPPLAAIGDVGSGKTRTLKGVAELYGIPFRAAKVEEQLEPNFWPNVHEGGLFVLDNADTRCRWLADALAAAATDGCSQRRKLYTTSETVTLRANAWLAITSANPTFGNDAGLADRLLTLRMERGEGDTSDSALTEEILANRNAGLSHICMTLRRALEDTENTPPGLNARHPDFASFSVKLGRALGCEDQAIETLKAAEADKSTFCLENDAIAYALMAFLTDVKKFYGTSAELVPKLCEIDSELKERLSAKRLSKRMSMLWPHLQKKLSVAKRETDRKGFTLFRLEMAGNAEIAEIEMDFSLNPSSLLS